MRIPVDLGEDDFSMWENEEEPEAAKLPEWTAHGVRVKQKEEFGHQIQNLTNPEILKGGTWGFTPKRTRLLSGGSRRQQFQGSPGKIHAQTTYIEKSSLSIGSRKLNKQVTEHGDSLSIATSQKGRRRKDRISIQEQPPK